MLEIPRGAVLIAGLVGVGAAVMAIAAILTGDFSKLVEILVAVVLINSMVIGVPWILSRFDKWQKQRQQVQDHNRALAINAEREHRAYLQGEDRLGMYGQFPPPPEILGEDR